MLKITTMPKNGKGFSILTALNRDVKPAQVTKLAESINKMGVIRPIVVTNFTYNGKKALYIVDGQHLYYALLRNNMDFPYVEITVKDEKDLVEKIALLNSSSKSWTLFNYIQSWSYIKSDYKTLIKYFNTYDLEISQIADILSNNTVSNHAGGYSISKNIKRGDFYVVDEKKSVKILDCITDVLKIIPRLDRISNKTFISAYVDYINLSNYNHSIFCEKLKKHIKELRLVTADKDTVLTFLKKLN